MIIPYSTDAPIYYFPWMTIVLIVLNAISFLITGGGHHNHGWLLTYGHGLHPLEWLTWNFLHFGLLHLVINMFFLWAFGIVVEGKLGWWKFLLTYLAIGIMGGFITQVAMLWFEHDLIAQFPANPASERWLWSDSRLYAQDVRLDMDEDDDTDVPQAAPKQGDADAPPVFDAGNKAASKDQPVVEDDSERFGAGGASLAIFGLMAIVLIWAPRNEVLCMFIGFNAGTFEAEYLYFCGFYIVSDLLWAIFVSTHNVFTTEMLHSTGAILGAIAGTAFLKLNWVDCERWDLFSVIRGDHLKGNHIAEWQNYYAPRVTDKAGAIEELADQQDAGVSRKKKIKPRLKQLQDLDNVFDSLSEDVAPRSKSKRKNVQSSDKPKKRTARKSADYDDHRQPTSVGRRRFDRGQEYEIVDDSDDEILEVEPVTEDFPAPAGLRVPPPVPRRSGDRQTPFSANSGPAGRVRELLDEGEFQDAYSEYLDYRTRDPEYRLPEEELRLLSNGLFQERAAAEAAPLLDEYIRRFPADSDRQKVKLAVLYVKLLQRPVAALKLLVKVDAKSLAKDYREIHDKAGRYAQEMVSDGVTDLEG